MKLGLITSAWVGSEYEGLSGLERTRDIGFDALELAVDPLDFADGQQAVYTEHVRSTGLPVCSVLVITLGLTDPFFSVRRFHLERAKRHIDFAADVGCPLLVVGLGEYIWEHQVIAPEVQWRWAMENVRELARHGAVVGVEIAMEIEPLRMSMLNSIAKAEQFLYGVDHPGVHINVDCSHLWLLGEPPEKIVPLREHIAHAHLSDCNGETHGDLPPGYGNTPLRKYIQALRDAGFEGVVSIELEFPPRPDQAVEWVTTAYEEGRKLLRGD